MFERPRGTNDWGPEDMAKRRFVESRFIQLAESFGFREVSTPTFESLELFTAKSGPAIVRELYAFKDQGGRDLALRDRKSTRLNSSHSQISYAVFCLKKKKKQ